MILLVLIKFYVIYVLLKILIPSPSLEIIFSVLLSVKETGKNETKRLHINYNYIYCRHYCWYYR